MRNLWSKEDLANFKKSEVLSELETRVINTVKRADILSRKISEASAADAISNADKLTAATNSATEAVESLNKAMNEADDHALEDDAKDDLQENIVDDLLALAKSAVEQGDYKLAYKIERTIDEILEHEVICG